MLDLYLVMALGFLGSFGHCIGMCGPLTIAFSLSQKKTDAPGWQQQLQFHGLLNLGRVISYALVGAAIGAVGSVLVAGGQVAGIDSLLRRSITIFTGLLLVWMGLAQVVPNGLPRLPFLHPLTQRKLHDRLSSAMMHLSLNARWWTPALLGMVWGLIPCGFLYAAQVMAAGTGNLQQGAATMLAFGLGTMPSMLGIGLFSSWLSQDQRSQLFRLGGWLTLTIGILTLLRTDEMVDYTGHASLLLLGLALVARPISRFWSTPLRYRRALGVGAFVLAIAHTFHMVDHSFSWQVDAFSFMLPIHQVAIGLGGTALILMLPAALTSFDGMVKRLGHYWRWLHLLALPAFILAALHTVLIGSSYLGSLEWTMSQQVRIGLLGVAVLGVLLVRSRWVWALLSLEKFYTAPARSNLTSGD